jgi:hypothetical protein
MSRKRKQCQHQINWRRMLFQLVWRCFIHRPSQPVGAGLSIVAATPRDLALIEVG